MKKLFLLLLLIATSFQTIGCRQGLDDDSQNFAVASPEIVPSGVASFETNEYTSPEAVQTDIQDALNSVSSIRAQQIFKAQTLPTGLSLPNLENQFISLSSSLSPVLAKIPTAELAQNIDFAALVKTFSLTEAQLQQIIVKAKGILVNLKDLQLDSIKANPIFKAALNAKVPVIFENQSVLTDLNNNWNTSEATAEAEKMAAAIGIGVEGQVSILLPTSTTGDFNLALIGATGKHLLENLTSAFETSDMEADGNQFEAPQVPEKVDSPPSPVLASRTDQNSYLIRDGYNDGQYSSYYYRGFNVGEWKKSYWKPDKDKDQQFRNNVRFYVQLTYNEFRNKKFLRFFTVGAFEMLNEPLKDVNNQRGYFQFYNSVQIKPVDSSGDVITPTGLTRGDYKPASTDLTFENRNNYVKTDTNLPVKNSYLYRNSGFYRPCYKILRWISTPGAKWVCRLAEGGNTYMQNFNPGSSWKAYEIWGGTYKSYIYTKKIDSWKDMIDNAQLASDRVMAGHPFSFIVNHRPHYHLIYEVDLTKTSQRFMLSATQGARMVWKGRVGKTAGHDDQFNTTKRYITVDFSQVGP